MFKLHCWHQSNLENYKDDKKKLELFQMSEEKLKKYLFGYGMPSMELLKASRILDPKQFKHLDHDLKCYVQMFPKLKNANAEWLQYVNIVNESSFNAVFDLNEFSISNKKKLPNVFELAE